MDEDKVPKFDGHIDVEVAREDREEPLDHQKFKLAGGYLSMKFRDESVHQKS